MSPTPEPSPDDPPTSPERASQLKAILISSGIIQPISEVIVKGSGLKGEGFGGVTEYVTVTFEDANSKPLNLFIKRKPDNNPTYDMILENLQSYQIETMFFMGYIPVAREFCKAVGHEEFMEIYPKCYYGDDTMILMENLVVGKGFFLLKKEELHNFETAKIALTTLAKHHAISHGVIQKLGGSKPFLSRFPKFGTCPIMSELGRGMLSPMFESSIDTNINILGKCPIEGSSETVEKLKLKKGKAFDEIVGSLKVTDDEFLVLVHGDYWNNNMMFLKDKDTNQMVDHVAIDFQGARYASPGEDLAYFLFTSVKLMVRRERFRELLTIYVDALKKSGNDLGCPIDISVEQVEAGYCRHFYIGYWMGMGLTTGPGYEVMKDLELAGDMEEMMANWERLISTWIREHPEECKVKAQNIIDYIKDYEQFSGRQIV